MMFDNSLIKKEAYDISASGTSLIVVSFLCVGKRVSRPLPA
jgi:hypothetical protein